MTLFPLLHSTSSSKGLHYLQPLSATKCVISGVLSLDTTPRDSSQTTLSYWEILVPSSLPAHRNEAAPDRNSALWIPGFFLQGAGPLLILIHKHSELFLFLPKYLVFDSSCNALLQVPSFCRTSFTIQAADGTGRAGDADQDWAGIISKAALVEELLSKQLSGRQQQEKYQLAQCITGLPDEG